MPTEHRRTFLGTNAPITARIEAALSGAGWTYADLARRCGSQASHFYNAKAGSRSWGYLTLERIEKVPELGFESGELLKLKASPKDEEAAVA